MFLLIADCVFEGGGIKGIGLVGAVCYLEEKGYKWNKLAGTSAGAIVASLLSANYSGNEIKKMIFDFDFENIFIKETSAFLSAKNPINLFIEKGIISGNLIENWIRNILLNKSISTFKDVSLNGESRLKIIASDITRQELLILPDDLIKYNIEPLNFEIAKAVRMSISIPFLFKPVKLKYNNTFSYIIDGGILSNYPVWIFDVQSKPRWPTFGFKLIEPNVSKTFLGKTDFISYTLDIINTLLSKNEEIYVKEKDWVRTIPIPTLGIKTIEFNLSEKKKKALFESGYNSAKKFLDSWNFEKYVLTYRK
ncbi:phospholipase [Caloramator sp. E03]|uniref:patatin-like phospholipase family protein n=1 Tax=Caloramator sp. E03 TaxID=2576307 RepID=UPI0011102405|nr:patatin-like phospholipase family protein [Caloramator sp. E03]QCX34764.1 phospholipase [Caloramator sp. E03]